ncbi:MAG: hypothetical protein WD771_06755 [Gemmatimonadaceae bacterium]
MPTTPNHATWVAEHGAEAPPRLVARVQDVLAHTPGLAQLPLDRALIQAGEQLLIAVHGHGEAVTRDAALDLLAADACVTWAFEAAAGEPATIGAKVESAIQRITELSQ